MLGPPPDPDAWPGLQGTSWWSVMLCLRLIFLLLLLFGGVGAAPARGCGRPSTSTREEDRRARRASNEANRRQRSSNADSGTSLPTTTAAPRRWSLPTNGAHQLNPNHQFMCRLCSVAETFPPLARAPSGGYHVLAFAFGSMQVHQRSTMHPTKPLVHGET